MYLELCWQKKMSKVDIYSMSTAGNVVMIKADTFGDFPIYRLWSCIFGMFACLVRIIISTSCANYAITKKLMLGNYLFYMKIAHKEKN